MTADHSLGYKRMIDRTCHTPFSIGNGDYGTHEYMEDITFTNCTVRGGLTPNDLRFKPVTAAAPVAPSFEA